MKAESKFTAKQVGDRIRERRTELRLSTNDLGERLGVNKSTIQRHEANGVDPKKTYLLCRFTGFPSLAFALMRYCGKGNSV